MSYLTLTERALSTSEKVGCKDLDEVRVTDVFHDGPIGRYVCILGSSKAQSKHFDSLGPRGICGAPCPVSPMSMSIRWWAHELTLSSDLLEQ